MTPRYSTRRKFVQSSAAGLAALSGSIDLLSQLPVVTAAEAGLKPGLVSFHQHIEPLVQLIEETPRDSVLEKLAAAIHDGRSYQEVLAAVLLAGIRNVQPRPSVGFKFHCVLVVNSCHLASLAGPDQDRWLPIFWAVDYFKSSQASEARESGWKMSRVNESLVPSAEHARGMFIQAMDNWDVDQADAATAGLARTAGAIEVFQLFAGYAARDFRSIGHKAIYLANAWRTLQVIGWEFAEPVLRSLTFALLNHSGEPNPSTSDLDADRPWRENAELLSRIPTGWLDGRLDDGVPPRLFETFRSESPLAAAQTATDALSRGVAAQSIWDGVFLGAGELLMRQPGIIGLHGLTTANAMHFLWKTVGEDQLRQKLLLQACSFNVKFREAAQGRGKLNSNTLAELQPAAAEKPEEALNEILADISGNRMRAASKVCGFLEQGGSSDQLIDAARRLLFIKGRDAHDYKFIAAVLEDQQHISPAWQNRFLATSVFNLKGTGHPDSGLLNRTRTALQKTM